MFVLRLGLCFDFDLWFGLFVFVLVCSTLLIDCFVVCFSWYLCLGFGMASYTSVGFGLWGTLLFCGGLMFVVLLVVCLDCRHAILEILLALLLGFDILIYGLCLLL